MTWARMRAYAAAIDRERQRKERALVIMLRAAQHYTPEEFVEFLKD